MRFFLTILLLVAFATMAFGQGITARMSGTVTDPQGAAIVGAQVLVVNVDMGTPFKASTNERGEWVIPGMPNGTYRVAVSMQGFKTTTIENVKMDAGVPQTVNAKLELGQLTETVEVNAGAEIVQTTTATVNSTIQGRQVFELPYITRNALDLLVTQPGTQTGGNNRDSHINGLPTGAINITTDGINTQDNYYRSGDGFFTLIPVRADSIEEVTLTTSAAGADSSAGGGAQVKFVTRGGTNEYHGGVFWQHRNTALNANYYFNNIDGMPRDRIILNQGGVHVGGPVLKNRLFFFDNFEIYRLPATSAATRTVLTPAAINGDFSYLDTTNKDAPQLRTINVLSLAGSKGFTGTPDPILLKTLQQINSLTGNGALRSRVATASDYNRNELTYQPAGMAKNYYNTMRLDYNVTDKHHLSFIHTYFLNSSVPDITNSVVPIYPGTGTVLGKDNLVAGQRGNRYAGVVALRSSFSPTITNELRAGQNRSLTLFRDEISSPALFDQWRGYSLGSTMGAAGSSNYVTGVASVSTSSRRTSPVREIHDNLSWVKGSHLLSVGFDFTQINFWYVGVNNAVIPTVSFGLATGDPINSGTTSIFTNTNFPGASSTQLTQAGGLYALLTGRVSSIGRSVVLDEKTHKYGSVPQVERNRQREYGGFFQDNWRVTPRLTLNLGLRYERQGAFQNINGLYSSVSWASAWGISGIGNLFAPGVMNGVNPQYDALTTPYKTPSTWSPSGGFAYQLPGGDGILGKLFGSHDGASVIRAGYSLATVREGSNIFQMIYGSNQGVNLSTTVNPGSYPLEFGAPGSVLFRDPTLPSRTYQEAPQYPIIPTPANDLNAFDPNLKMGYVQSWNLGFQRELTKNMVMEVRYTGNQGVHMWRQYELNEVNVFENGFLKEFGIAQNNLAIARAAQAPGTTPTNNFGNQGLPGQFDVPILKTALNTTTDFTTATQLRQNTPGATAGAIFANSTRMGRLTAAGYPANMFVVNPAVPAGGSYIVTNAGNSNYNSMQVEVRRRMTAGLLMQGSYTWSHSIANGATASTVAFDQPTTLRNLRLDRDPAPFDIRHALKLNWIYELPLGPGKRYGSGVGNPILKKAIQGWEIAGVGRIQTGTPGMLTSGRDGMNNNDNGLVLYNMTTSDLQKMMKVRKETGSDGKGIVYYLPQDLIDNTLAAFELGSKNWDLLDKSKPYIGPQLGSGQFGQHIFLYGPRQTHLDLSVVKITPFGEGLRKNVEFRAQFLDALNLQNFYLQNYGSINANFGQTKSGYRDFSGSGDPGARMIEFILRVNF